MTQTQGLGRRQLLRKDPDADANSPSRRADHELRRRSHCHPWGSLTVTESAGEFDPVRVIKPWGEELLFAAVEGGYAGKLITIHAGRSASLHRHQRKTETIMVLTGTGHIRLGTSPDSLALLELQPGSCVHIPASVLHRVSARSELQFVEVSTAYEGWRADVERLEDSPGGTSTP